MDGEDDEVLIGGEGLPSAGLEKLRPDSLDYWGGGCR
jgi:hypothetical protein